MPPSQASLRAISSPSILKMLIVVFVSLIVAHQNHLANADIAVISPNNRTVDVFIDIELGFSQPVPYDGLIGHVVLAEPEDACSKLTPPSNSTQKWIVLMRRPSCPLATKVRHAMDAGYSAAIIYNIDLASTKGKFSTTAYYPESESAITIPAVLISFDDGITLKREYLYTTGFYVMIIPELPFNINAYLLPFAIVIGICLLLIISFMIFQIVKCIRDRRRLRKHRLSSRHLKKLPLIKYNKGDHYDTCAICLEEYIEGEKLRILPCDHGYHVKCIDPWLTKNRRVCPVCKGKVVLPGMSDDSDSDSDGGHNSGNRNASERTPLLSRDRRSNRQRDNRRRVRSFPQSSLISSRQNTNADEAATSSSNVPSGEGTSSLVTDNYSSSTPNVTLIVEADVSLAPSDHSLNCDHEREESSIEVTSGQNRPIRITQSAQRSSPRRSRQDVIV